MKQFKIINIQGKWYRLLLMSGGKAYLSSLYDLDNEVHQEGIIWKMQPFFYQDEIWYGNIYQRYINIIRTLKALWPSGLGEALQKPLRRFDPV